MKRIVPLLVLLILLCVIAATIETPTHILRHAVDNILYDNHNHYLPCEKLPTVEQAEKVLEERSEIIWQIEQVNPGLVGVEIDTSTCPGKADLIIWYASHQNRVEIEKIIAAKTFFGVPFRLQNR